MFGNLFDIEKLVKKYLLKLLHRYAKKNNLDPENVAIMLQTDPRSENKTMLFSGWRVEEIKKHEFKEWIPTKQIIETLKED